MPRRDGVTRFKRLAVVFTLADEAAFSRALRAAYPDVLILPWDIRNGPQEHRSFETLAENDSGLVRLAFPGTVDWHPEFRKLDDGWWTYANYPWASLSYRRGDWMWGERWAPDAKWAFEMPTLEYGEFNASYLKFDTDTLEFLNGVWRFIDRFTVRSVKVGNPRLEDQMERRRGSMPFGHDALRWCAQRPHRVLDGAFRPTDGYRFPDWPWYRAEELAQTDEIGVEQGYGGDAV